MNGLSDIKRRLVSVKQIRQITGAMETVSIAKMQKALARFDGYRSYAAEVERAVENIMSSGEEATCKYLTPACGTRLDIVIASDKGLCGAFNHDVFKLADAVGLADPIVIPIGQTAADRYSSRENTDMRFVSLGSADDYAKVMPLARAVLNGFGKDFSSVALVYTELVSHTAWRPTVKTILPIQMQNDGATAEPHAAVVAEPSAEAVLDAVMPLYVASACFGAILESAAAEHSARRVAMSASAKSADEMIAALSVEYNRARQNTVTEQITEIIGSMSALNATGGAQ